MNAVLPTKLKKISIVLSPELQAALEAYARRSKRSLSNAGSILLEQQLIITGDLSAPVQREETRGGDRKSKQRDTSPQE